jgi:hypothetical protein
MAEALSIELSSSWGPHRIAGVVTHGVGSEALQGGAHLGQFSFRIALLHT